MRILRMLLRVFAESGLGLWRSGWLNVWIVGILMSTLIIFGLMLQVSLGIKKFASNMLGSHTEFSIFLKDEVEPQAYMKALEANALVSKVVLNTKEDAWNQLQTMLKLELEPSMNSMPNTLKVTVHRPQDAIKLIRQLRSSVEDRKKIEDITYAPSMVRKLNTAKNLMIVIGSVITLLLAVGTFIINFNTIELVIRARRDELRLLRFMGVTNWFIKGPLILQGVIYGLASATLAIFLLSAINGGIRYRFNLEVGSQIAGFAQLWPDSVEMSYIFAILTLSGVLCSSASSFWATERRMNV